MISREMFRQDYSAIDFGWINMNKPLKAILMCITFLALLPFMVSCQDDSSADETKRQRLKNFARYVDEDGWVYTCAYTHYSDGLPGSSAPVAFNVINLRYRSDSGSIQILGDGVSPETDRDMHEIATFLGYGESAGTERPTLEELLAQDRSTLKLEVLDEELFFKLFDEAVSGEPREAEKYIEYSGYALLAEPAYKNEYRFQIGFRLGMGHIDVIMIDVLYQNSDSPNGYVQLYDLVRDGTATEEQLSLYETIKAIEEGIVSTNDFCYGKSQYSSKKIASCELSRLYKFLKDIDKMDYMKYSVFSQG